MPANPSRTAASRAASRVALRDLRREVSGRCAMDAWAPAVPGIAEVLHARIVDWQYPPHTHDTWALLVVDEGAISYRLDGRHCGAGPGSVTVIPPGVVHDGRPAPGAAGFRKRELYLDADFLPSALTGAAVEQTNLDDAALTAAIRGVHRSLRAGEEAMDVEGRLAVVAGRLSAHLSAHLSGDLNAGLSGDLRGLGEPPARDDHGELRLAHRLRELLDAHVTESFTLAAAAAELGRSVAHLVRSFSAEFGVSPHAYVIGRRIDQGRRRLLRGARPAELALELGFHDQAHFTRHFRRHLLVTPAKFGATRTATGTA